MKGMITKCVMAVMSLLLVACDGAFDGLYDDAMDDDQQQSGFGGDVSHNRFTIQLDARSYNHWHYIDLKERSIVTKELPSTLTGEWDGKSVRTYYNVHGTMFTENRSEKIDAQQDAEHWDIAIHHFDVRTNGGAVLETRYTTIDEAPESSDAFAEEEFTEDEWTTHQCIVDLTDMMAYNVWYNSSPVNMVLSRWVTMDFSTPPPVYTASNKVYVLRMSNGQYAALRLVDYMSDRGTKGFLTIDVKYPY